MANQLVVSSAAQLPCVAELHGCRYYLSKQIEHLPTNVVADELLNRIQGRLFVPVIIFQSVIFAAQKR